MRRLLVLLTIALPLVAAVPTVTITGFDGLSHSNVRVSYQTDVVYDHWRTRTLASPDTCTGNALGKIGPDVALGPGVSHPTSNTSVLVSGLTASTVYNICVDAHNDDGWSNSATVQITTPPLPSVHPALPIAPDSWDSSYPDTTGYTSVTAASDCSDLQAKISDAQWAQATHGTIINIPPGSVCTSMQQIQTPVFALDIVPFRDSNVTAGSPGSIAFPHATFTEGQLVTFGRRYADGGAQPPSSSSCSNGNGFTDGGKYFIHIVSDDGTTQHVNVDCGDGSGTRMVFGDVGATIRDLQFVPHFLTTGNCPTTKGPKTCTYWARHLFWIVIRSGQDDAHLPPVNTRADDAYAQAGYYATLVNPTANIGQFNSSHFFITAGTNDGQDGTMAGNVHWGPGIRVMNADDPGSGTYCAMAGISQIASGWVFDRVIFKGTGQPQRWGGPSCPAYYFNGHNFAFRDSEILNMTHWYSSGGTDGSGGTLSRGPGPITIYDNLIQGAAAPLMHFDDQGGPEFITQDHTIVRNTFQVPMKYCLGVDSTSDGFFYGIRQSLEFKAGSKNLIEGNVFDGNCTQDVPTSSFIVLTSVNGKPITDTAIYRNIFKHGPGGNTIQVVGGNARITLPPNRYAEIGNLFYDIDGIKYTANNSAGFTGHGWFAQGPNGGEDITIDQNTIVGNIGLQSAFFWNSNYPTEGVKVTNNFMYISKTAHAVGQDGDVGANDCTAMVDEALMDCWFSPGYVWSHNVMLSGDASKTELEAMFPGLKTSNYIPTDTSLASGGWLSMALNDYRVLHTYCGGCGSPGTNHQTIGADINALDVATGAVELTGVPETGLTTTSAHVQFNAPDAQGCPVDWSTAPDIMASFTRVSDAGGARSRDITLTGLSAHTVYYFRVNCATVQPTGQFKTR